MESGGEKREAVALPVPVPLTFRGLHPSPDALPLGGLPPGGFPQQGQQRRDECPHVERHPRRVGCGL